VSGAVFQETSADFPVLVDCREVSFGYGGHPVVRNLTFTVRQRDYLCIVGENGCGKSTLVRGILRLISPLGGSIVFSPDMKADETGCLLQQEAAKKDFPAGVSEIVLSGMAGRTGLRPFYTRREKETALENMRRLEVADLRNRCFRELSGGQQRRVLIARALCAARKLLVLDEPSAGLDPLVTNELYELLARINQEGITIVMVTHDIQAALKYAGRILHIAGEKYFYGSVSGWEQSGFLKSINGGER